VKVTPPTTRSTLVLELGEELALRTRVRAAKVFLDMGSDTELGLFGSSTIAGIHAVAEREVALAIVNPSATLTLAFRGTGPFPRALPVRTIAVIPSRDEIVLAVNPSTGLESVDDIARQRPRLRIGVRAQKDHSLHFILDDIMRASGFTRNDVDAWGGEFRFDGSIPEPDSPKFRALVDGSLDAIFDEGADEWLEAALDAGMSILSLSESAVQALEAQGYRRAILSCSQYPRLRRDVLTVDFSGWAIFVHSETSDKIVTQLCEALEARKHRIPWQDEGPLPLERMVTNPREAPYDVPLHAAAERFWRERGYLPSASADGAALAPVAEVVDRANDMR
jgi:TRAP-type uncharacterized transport system substrate-binding protein